MYVFGQFNKTSKTVRIFFPKKDTLGRNLFYWLASLCNTNNEHHHRCRKYLIRFISSQPRPFHSVPNAITSFCNSPQLLHRRHQKLSVHTIPIELSSQHTRVYISFSSIPRTTSYTSYSVQFQLHVSSQVDRDSAQQNIYIISPASVSPRNRYFPSAANLFKSPKSTFPSAF